MLKTIVPSNLKWENIFDGYGSKNLSHHLSRLSANGLLQYLLEMAQWDVLTFWDIQNLDQRSQRALYAKIDFVLSLVASRTRAEDQDGQIDAILHVTNGILFAMRRDYARSIDSLWRSFRGFRKMDNDDQLFMNILLLAGVYYQKNDFGRSQGHCMDAIAIARKMNDSYKLALSKYVVGVIMMAEGRLLEATDNFLEIEGILGTAPIDPRVSRLYLKISEATLNMVEQLIDQPRKTINAKEYLETAKSYFDKGFLTVKDELDEDLLTQYYLEKARLCRIESYLLRAAGKVSTSEIENGLRFAYKAMKLSKRGYRYMNVMFEVALCYYFDGKELEALKRIGKVLKPFSKDVLIENFTTPQGWLSAQTDWRYVARLYELRGSLLIKEYLDKKDKLVLKDAAEDYFVALQHLSSENSPRFFVVKVQQSIHTWMGRLTWSELQEIKALLEILENKYCLKQNCVLRTFMSHYALLP